jgi:two-component system sensor histidine kinase AgrC
MFVFFLIPFTQLAPIVANAIFIAFLAFYSNKKIKNLHLCIFFAVFTNIIILLSASFANTAFYFALRTSLGDLTREDVMSNLKLHIPYALLVTLIGFIISYKIGKVFHKYFELVADDLKKFMSPFLSFGSLITLLPFWVFTFFGEAFTDEPIPPILNAFSFVMFFALLVFALIIFTRSTRKESDFRIKEEAQYRLLEYIRYVENMATATREFKHDHKNLLLGFRNFIESNDLDGLHVYYETYLESFQAAIARDDNAVSLDLLNRVSHPVLKGLIAAKLQYSAQLSIDIGIDIPNQMHSVPEDKLVDLCRIVGILFDNAIESCHDNPGSKLSFGIATLPASVMFIFENTLPVPAPSIEKMHECGYSTKGENRGVGLYTTSQILQRNNDLSLETRFELGNLVQLLTFHK